MSRKGNKIGPGIYRAVVRQCKVMTEEGFSNQEINWALEIVEPRHATGGIKWSNEIQNLEQFEEVQAYLSALGIALERYHDMEVVCPDAVGKWVFIEVPPRDSHARPRFLQLATEPRPAPPPFWERMSRSEAQGRYLACGLQFFDDTLENYMFPEERISNGGEEDPEITPG